MTCNKCFNKAKEVTFQSFSYWYCETCKEEVGEKEFHIQPHERVDVTEALASGATVVCHGGGGGGGSRWVGADTSGGVGAASLPDPSKLSEGTTFVLPDGGVYIIQDGKWILLGLT